MNSFCLGVTWIITLGRRERQNGLCVLGTLIYERIKLKRWGRLNQSLIYIHPFPALSPQFSYLPLFNTVVKKLLLSRKNAPGKEGIVPLLLLQVTPMAF